MDCKYIILVGDGMADYPVAELNGKTPLQAARTPHIDGLLAVGRVGLVRTIPDGMEPGSDVANMSLLGYDPLRYHTGRAPIEAASMGVQLHSEEVAFRCNLVTLERDREGVLRMLDYSAGHITTAEAHELVGALQQAVEGSPLRLYPGVSYRHLLVWANGREDFRTTPPHDISGKPAEPHQEVYRREEVLFSFMEKAGAILADHPVNRRRIAAGRRPANAVWLWGQGRTPSMPTLKERYGLTGAMISAVDLLKGLGVYAGLEPIFVPGATGYLDTNYAGKVAAALQALEIGDLVYVHIEAPDEAGHEGSLEKKVEAIEAFDANVVGPILAQIGRFHKVRLLIETDHPTPISIRTHATDPVPFLLVEAFKGSEAASAPAETFCEALAKASGWNVGSGFELFDYFIKGC
ncbi:MAG: cofactor-independent phosphoglycerate mutase [Desulforhabdus sp.]|jgi:2,3-bisphosphoglycerate-independent phosphoglycerate mutase|nr:cofactor-independent phosphoglycerate mutase [Desulforhabdus sp.]